MYVTPQMLRLFYTALLCTYIFKPGSFMSHECSILLVLYEVTLCSTHKPFGWHEQWNENCVMEKSWFCTRNSVSWGAITRCALVHRQICCHTGSCPTYDSQQGRNFKFLSGIGNKRDDGTEPPSLVSTPNIPRLNAKFLCTAFVVKAYVLFTVVLLRPNLINEIHTL